MNSPVAPEVERQIESALRSVTERLRVDHPDKTSYISVGSSRHHSATEATIVWSGNVGFGETWTAPTLPELLKLIYDADAPAVLRSRAAELRRQAAELEEKAGGL